jgi:2-oxoacid:acceptor oxidoreductase gamma subunit (pyruvate/2-ketoisovalerate family)
MRGYNRVSDRPIRRRGPIEEPGVVVVLDPSLLKDPSLIQGLQPGGLVLANSAQPAQQIEQQLPELAEDFRVHVVDATEIARAETGTPIPNTVMLGALVSLTGVADLAAVRETVRVKLEKKVGSGGRLLAGNLSALERAHKEVQ